MYSLVKRKRSSISIIQGYTGSFEKLKPNNKRIYSYLEKTSNCKIKNAYNLYDSNNETLGIVFSRVVNTDSYGGISVSFMPLGEDGYYAPDQTREIYKAVFKYQTPKDNFGDFWFYENPESIPSSIKSSTDLEEITHKDNSRYLTLKNIKGSKAAPKIITKLSSLVKSFYKNDLKIDRAFNDITYNDL